MEISHPQDRSASIARKEHLMPLIDVVFALIAVGVLLWLVNRFIPMQGRLSRS